MNRYLSLFTTCAIALAIPYGCDASTNYKPQKSTAKERTIRYRGEAQVQGMQKASFDLLKKTGDERFKGPNVSCRKNEKSIYC